MGYIWELIKAAFSFFMNRERKDNREDFKTAFDSLYSLTELLIKQLDKQELEIDNMSKKLEYLEEIKFLARKFKLELQKCEQAYAREKEKNRGE